MRKKRRGRGGNSGKGRKHGKASERGFVRVLGEQWLTSSRGRLGHRLLLDGSQEGTQMRMSPNRWPKLGWSLEANRPLLQRGSTRISGTQMIEVARMKGLVLRAIKVQ